MISENKTLIKNRPGFFRNFYYEKGGHDYVDMEVTVYSLSNEYHKFA